MRRVAHSFTRTHGYQPPDMRVSDVGCPATSGPGTRCHPLLRRGHESGQALIETALVLPVVLLIVFGALKLGAAVHTWQQVSAAASEGARKAIVSAASGDPVGAATTAAQQAAPNLDSSLLGVTVSSPTWEAGDPATVTTTYPLTITVLGTTIYDGTISSTRTMMVSS